MALCPNCQQPLPVPSESFCPSCGAALGTPRPPRPGATGGSIPWEERQQLGFVSAFFETSKQVLMGPTSFFQRMPVEGGIQGPLIYGALAGYIGLLTGAIYGTVAQAIFASSLSGMSHGEGNPLGSALFSGGLNLVLQVVLGPIQIIVGLFMVSGILQLMLMLFSGGGKGFEATFRVVCFSQAAALLGIIPVCGFFAGLYSIVLQVIGIAEAHGISRGKAALVVLLPIALMCCCCTAVIMVFFGSIAGMLSQLQR